MSDTTLSIPVRRTDVSLESDRPLTGVYHVTYHIHDALAAPWLGTLPDGRTFADFSRVEGRLAESFSANDDQSRWVVTLREGVRSHAGNLLTAEDVVWSYQRVFALRAIGMWRMSTIAGVPAAGIRALDSRRVEFRIEGHNPVFPRYLCYGTAAIVDSREAAMHATPTDPWAGDWLGANPCGFGGWSVLRHDAERLEFAPRQDSWLGPIPVDGVRYLHAASREAGIEAFLRGDANALVGLLPDEAETVRRLPNVRLLLSRTNHASIELNAETLPFAHADIRRAAALAIPYERVLAEGYLGYAEPQRSIYQPNTPAPEPSAPNGVHDPAEARRLVRGAAAVPSRVRFATPRSAESDRIAAIVCDAWTDAGIPADHVYIEDLSAGDAPEAYLRDDCSHGIADEHYDLGIDFAPPRNMPNRLWQQGRLSPEMRAIRLAPSAEQRGMYAALNDRIVATGQAIPLAGHSYVIAVRDVHPWFLSEAYLPLKSLRWSSARYILPPVR